MNCEISSCRHLYKLPPYLYVNLSSSLDLCGSTLEKFSINGDEYIECRQVGRIQPSSRHACQYAHLSTATPVFKCAQSKVNHDFVAFSDHSLLGDPEVGVHPACSPPSTMGLTPPSSDEPTMTGITESLQALYLDYIDAVPTEATHSLTSVDEARPALAPPRDFPRLARKFRF